VDVYLVCGDLVLHEIAHRRERTATNGMAVNRKSEREALEGKGMLSS